ncbi:MAG: tellurite resistance TerB family protein [Nostocaceae cyanobacterium]|nr:tellurite resistance TerB family protein [Nostocaceae cyanobacterium]
MGLFDKVFNIQNLQSQTQQTLSPAEAFAAICLAATASDGYFSEEEARGISFILSRMQLFKSYPHDVINRMFDKLVGILKRQGVSNLLNLAKQSLPYELRDTAFAVATDLVLADGVVTQEEQNLLNELYQALEVSPEVATQIVQIMLIKNRG